MDRVRVLLYGMGEKYNHARNIIKYYEYIGQIEVVGITAKQLPQFSILDGYPIIECDKLKNIDYDYIIVMSDKFYTEITSEVISEYNVPINKFIKCSILFIPNLDFKDYIALKESNISIVSNNCWGGIIYNTLGLQCLSPFKNLFVKDNDYLKLIRDLKRYMGYELVFDHYSVDPHSNFRYPVFKLDDIEIHCNHADSIESAVSDWDRRKQLINWNNIFVEMYTEDMSVPEKFESIDMYEKMVCFVPMGNDCNCFRKSFVLSDLMGNREFWKTVIDSASVNKNGLAYNLVDLLLSGKLVRRMQ